MKFGSHAAPRAPDQSPCPPYGWPAPPADLCVGCLPEGHRCRVPNAPAGHTAVADLAREREAVVCFESTGGQERQSWAHLEAEGVAARQVPPAQVKAFAQSRGTRAKTDRIDAELIARFFALLPEGGRSLPE
ncbi:MULTISPECIES: IS110 family transposase [unclassified Haematobacter]|uniref:IS110 family transposase n=1 Tax=unclassified Haematobacter TaxID=2640585 RepID=UPI0025BF06C6|nr:MULTISPECIES: transposase [unclassified Haematobacter]